MNTLNNLEDADPAQMVQSMWEEIRGFGRTESRVKMCRNGSNYEQPENIWNSVQHDQKLIMPEETHNECTNQVWS